MMKTKCHALTAIFAIMATLPAWAVYELSESKTFEETESISDSVWVGSGKYTSFDDCAVWQATEPTFGFDSTGDFLIADYDNQTAWLRILSGTYSFSKGMILGGRSGSYGHLKQEGGFINMSGTSYIGAGSSKGEWIMDGGTNSLKLTYIGENSGSMGEVTLNSGSVSVDGALVLGRYALSEGKVRMNGGSIALTNSARYNELNVGEASTATGIVEVAGGEFTVSSGARIGYGGIGFTTVTGTGKFYAKDYLSVGDADTATGLLTVAEGGLVEVTNTVYAGASGNGTVKTTGGRLIARSNMLIAQKSNSAGAIVVDGGEIEVESQLHACDGGSATATIGITNGTLTVGGEFRDGYGATATTTIDVGPNGILDVNGKMYLAYGGSGVGTLTVDGGTVYVRGDKLQMAEWADNSAKNAQATVIVKNGGVMDVAKDIEFGPYHGAADADPNTLQLYPGGTAVVTRVYMRSANTQDTGDKVIFKGGTLKARATTGELISKHDYLTVVVEPAGGTIDTASYGVVVPAAFTGTGNLTKTGSGQLTLSGESTCTGTLVVEEGFVALTGSWAGGIELKEGTKLILSKTDYVSGTTYGIPTITLPAGAQSDDYVIFATGARTTEVFNNDHTQVTITDLADDKTPVTSHWIGGSGNTTTNGNATIEGDMDDWKDSWWMETNWSHGVPTNIDTVVFNAGANLYARDRIGYEVAKLVIRNGARVQIKSDYETNNYYIPVLKPHEIDSDSTGTLVLWRCSFKTVSGYPVTIPVGLTLEVKSDSDTRTYIGGDADLTVNGPMVNTNGLMEVSSKVVINGLLTLDAEGRETSSGTNYSQIHNSTIGGTFTGSATIDGSFATAEGAKLGLTFASGGTISPLTIMGTANLANAAVEILGGENNLAGVASDDPIVIFKATTIENWTKQTVVIDGKRWSVTTSTYTDDSNVEWQTLLLTKKKSGLVIIFQ